MLDFLGLRWLLGLKQCIRSSMVKGFKAAEIIPCSGLSLGTQTSERAPRQISKNKSHPVIRLIIWCSTVSVPLGPLGVDSSGEAWAVSQRARVQAQSSRCSPEQYWRFKCVFKVPESLGIGLINSPGNQCRKRSQCGIVLRLQGKYSPGEKLPPVYFVLKT